MPESPRWLLMHGYLNEAAHTMDRIEIDALGRVTHAAERERISMVVTGPVRLREIVTIVFLRHRRRAILGLSLMVAQAFFYNAIFFTYGIILERFHGVKADRVGLYILPFALGNFAGPLLLGPLFDRLGRRIMIPLTYALSALLLSGTGALFVRGD